MANNVLKTSADDLYELVRLRKKISVEEVAKILKMPNNTVQALVDFLVEEKIFGIEYKFTTPFIYISQDKEKKMEAESTAAKKLVTKEEFFQKANKWNLSAGRTNNLWNKYIEENFGLIKENFYTRANSRSLSKEQTESLWKKYLAHLQ